MGSNGGLLNKRTLLPVAVAGLLVSGLLSAGSAEALAPRSVRIGVMGDLTGEYAELVVPIRHAVQLAVDRYNATGPRVRITVTTYDSQAKPEDAVALAKWAIVKDKIVGLVGPAFSGESAQVGPILEEAKVPSISPSATHPILAENGWRYWHRFIGDTSADGAGLAKLIGTDLKTRRVFFVDDGSGYGEVLAAAVKKGVKKTAPKAETRSARGIGPATVAKVRAFRPDVVLFGGYYDDAGRLVKRLRAAGVTAKFVADEGALDPRFAKVAGKRAAEGSYIGCGCLLDPHGTAGRASKAFTVAYKAKYNTPPSMYAAEAYDAATAFIQAVKAGATTRKAINSYLSRISHPGVTKRIAFKRNGEPAVARTYVYRQRGNAFPLYKRF